MSASSAPELTQLLSAADPSEEDAAWGGFVQAFTQPILAALRSLDRDHDLLMDRYAFVLERLREDRCRRLRSFADPSRTDFRIWLFVVARRLALDHYRHQYGRARSTDDDSTPGTDRAARRRLVDLVGEQLDPAELSGPATGRPDAEFARSERNRLLQAVVDELPAGDRLLLRLRFTQELSAREIADLMTFESPGHVYRRLDTVFRTLRAALGRLGVEEAEP